MIRMKKVYKSESNATNKSMFSTDIYFNAKTIDGQVDKNILN